MERDALLDIQTKRQGQPMNDLPGPGSDRDGIHGEFLAGAGTSRSQGSIAARTACAIIRDITPCDFPAGWFGHWSADASAKADIERGRCSKVLYYPADSADAWL